jgi:Uma2 family endonuclease
MTESEFLAFERDAETKHEFFDGEVFAMAGGTEPHSHIAANHIREIGNALKGRPCIAYNADLRVKVEATGLITYPDLSVVCGPRQFLDERRDTLLNPILLGEVLSDSTESYDRGKKFAYYRLISSLRHYLIASQHEPRLELYTHAGPDSWTLTEAAGLQAALHLPALEITLVLSEVFAQVEFSPAARRLH